MTFRYFIFIFLFLLFIPTQDIIAEDDYVFFYPGGCKEQETQIVYYGEYEIGLRIFFGNNCSNYNISVKSPLFTHPLGGLDPDRVDAGVIQDYALDINRNAQLGRYPIIVYFNYTNENKVNISRQFNLTLEYKKAFEIKEINIPKGSQRKFSLKIKTFENISELRVIFDSDGDIETEKEEIILNNVSKGDYVFETSVYRVNTFAGNAQELGYWVIGIVDNRTIEFGEKNIPVKITWKDTIINIFNNNSKFIYSGIIIILVVILICYYYKKYKNYRNN